MTPILTTSLLFLLCGGVILATGVRLSRYGDVIAEKTGLGGMWIGVLMMSAVTSLPELVAGASAVALFDAPELAVGDIAGSCLFNLLILAFLDFGERVPLSARIHQGHVLVAGFGLVQLGFAAFSMLAGANAPAIGWLGLSSVAFVAIHVLAIRMMFTAERHRQQSSPRDEGTRHAEMSLRRAVWLYVANAAGLVAAAVFLPGLGERLAAETGLDQSFVGSLFLAVSTSLPEVVVSVAAARIGAVDLAVGNLLGSNIFNIAILGVDDLLYRPGPLLASVSSVHVLSLVSAMIMTAIAVIGITYRAQRKRFRLSWEASAMIAVYVSAIGLVWQLSGSPN
jgi:cation:H+ antiporter